MPRIAYSLTCEERITITRRLSTLLLSALVLASTCALVSIGIAWSLALLVRYQVAPTTERLIISGRQTEPRLVFRAFGSTFVTGEQLGGQVREIEASDWLVWGTIRKMAGGAIETTGEARGWPFRCVYWELALVPNEELTGYRSEVQGGIALGWPRSLEWSSDGGKTRIVLNSVPEPVLPYKVFWPGLVGNAGTYCGAWLSFRWLLRRQVRAWRRRKNRCPGCGYDLSGLHATVCPECGAGSALR